jgi:hypothetical protein
MQATHSPCDASQAAVFILIACLAAGATTGCLKRTGTADSGNDVPTRNVRVPAEWTSISYYCAINAEEFVATGDIDSWRIWSLDYGMTAGPHKVHINECPTVHYLRVDFSYDRETCRRLEFRRSEVLPNGANRCTWFDPETKRVIFQESFW